MFDLLSHHRRRYVLACLRENGMMSLTDLADEVATRTYGKPIDDIGAQDREQVVSSLHHSHLPKLAEADMVEYERTTETVIIGAAVERAIPFLELVNDEATEVA